MGDHLGGEVDHPSWSTSACEPSADIRQLAGMAWQMYSALRMAGFTSAQALTLTVGLMRPPTSAE